MVEFDFGKLVKVCRKKAGLSQEAFADMLHTTQSTISRIEKNLIAVEARFLIKVGKVTNSEDVIISSLFSMDAIMQAAQLVPTFIFGGLKIWI
ncbi:helix-turn-helix domain-containing protein [Ureibacillus chungkukjangi]|uniref:helix-turn-helix domain-containing protein n=1 Tax=Ureibacillus chungkukjangi TaxID=1202712 RepID=UPI00384E6C22